MQELSGSLRLHVTRILRHLSDVDRSAFKSVYEYLREVSWFVESLYIASYTPETESSHKTVVSNVSAVRKSPRLIPCYVPDFVLDNVYSQYDGTGIDSQLAPGVQLHFLRLMELVENPVEVCFWGRVTGLYCAYLIGRAVTEDGSSTYFACPWSRLGEWIKLDHEADEILTFVHCPMPLVANGMKTLSCMVNTVERGMQWYNGDGLPNVHPVFDVSPPPLAHEMT